MIAAAEPKESAIQDNEPAVLPSDALEADRPALLETRRVPLELFPDADQGLLLPLPP
jgi:hypothetical protein